MLSVTSRDNTNIKNAVRLKKSARYRKESGLFCAEGVRICIDAVKSNAQIKTFFATEMSSLKHHNEFELLANYAEQTIIITAELFSAISDTESPQGFLCIIKALDKTIQFDTIKNDSRLIALENVQDPGNMGTILRTAEALNIFGIVISNDCCDIFSPKVVRGSMGAVFRIPYFFCSTVVDFLNTNQNIMSYAAVVNANAEKITDVCFQTPCVAVIGNEGNGLKNETIKACSRQITIPMQGKAESLNASVAASIIMWEMVR